MGTLGGGSRQLGDDWAEWLVGDEMRILQANGRGDGKQAMLQRTSLKELENIKKGSILLRARRELFCVFSSLRLGNDGNLKRLSVETRQPTATRKPVPVIMPSESPEPVCRGLHRPMDNNPLMDDSGDGPVSASTTQRPPFKILDADT